jgi:hypothetical protein
MTKYGSRGAAGIAYKQALDEAIMQKNPDFDFALNDQQYANANDPQFKHTMVYANSLLDRMGAAEKALDAYNKGDIKLFNKLSLNLGVQTGDPKAIGATINQFLVADEAQRLIGSGQGSETALQMAHQLADPTMSPAQTHAVLTTVKGYVQARRNEIADSMGPFGKMYTKNDYTGDSSAQPAQAGAAPSGGGSSFNDLWAKHGGK